MSTFSFHAMMKTNIGISVISGLVAGCAAAMFVKPKMGEGESSPTNQRVVASLWAFLLIFLIAYLTLYFMKKRTWPFTSGPRPDLETVMRHVKGGSPDF